MGWTVPRPWLRVCNLRHPRRVIKHSPRPPFVCKIRVGHRGTYRALIQTRRCSTSTCVPGSSSIKLADGTWRFAHCPNTADLAGNEIGHSAPPRRSQHKQAGAFSKPLSAGFIHRPLRREQPHPSQPGRNTGREFQALGPAVQRPMIDTFAATIALFMCPMIRLTFPRKPCRSRTAPAPLTSSSKFSSRPGAFWRFVVLPKNRVSSRFIQYDLLPVRYGFTFQAAHISFVETAARPRHPRYHHRP